MTRDTCGALRARLEERRAQLAALHARKSFIIELRRRLEDRRRGLEEKGEDEDEDEDEEWATVTADDVDTLRSTAMVIETTALDHEPGGSSSPFSPSSSFSSSDGGGGESRRRVPSAVPPSFDDLEVDVDDLEGCTAAELNTKLIECTRMCARAAEGVKELRQEVIDRRRWDEMESGVETRDVLENGVRRADMEMLLGRPVTKADVDASLAIPAVERARIVGGYDIERARLTGTHEYVKQLPGPPSS